MSYREFQIGFWHPFGPNSGETAEKILERKKKEIANNKWTLWSFRFRSQCTFETWYEEIMIAQPAVVYVFCSDGKYNKDPADKDHNKTIECKSYRHSNKDKWISIPAGVKVPHPFRKDGKKEASAILFGTAIA